MTKRIQPGVLESAVFISRAAAVASRVAAGIEMIEVLDEGVVRRLVRAGGSDPAAITTADGQRWKPTGQATFKLFGCDPGFTAAQNNAGIAEACLYGNIRVTNAVWQCSVPLVWSQNSAIVWDYGARINTTYRQASGALDTPSVTFGEGSVWNWFEISTPGGVTVGAAQAMGILVKDRCEFNGLVNKSDVYNDNIVNTTGDFERRGAIRLEGNNITGRNYSTENHRVGVRLRNIDGLDLKVGKIIRCSLGINIRNVTNFEIVGGTITSVQFKDQTRAFNANGLLTGENGFLCGGASRGRVAGFRVFDSLEHGFRFGSGIESINDGVTVEDCEFWRTWGAALKADDADAHTTVNITLRDLTAIDTGRDNAAARAPYGFETDVWPIVATSTWSNKEAFPLRNIEHVTVTGLRSRTNQYTYCGRIGLWIERSANINGGNFQFRAAQQDGFNISTNGFPAVNISIHGVASYDSGRYGAQISCTQNGDTMNKVTVTGLVMLNAATAQLAVPDRPDGSHGFSGRVLIEGFRKGSTGTSQIIGSSSAASVNFYNRTFETAA